MRERPILFSGPMVRAIMAGRKTQTRRILKGKLRDGTVIWNGDKGSCQVETPERFWAGFNKTITCPYGQPGDCLWVRETQKFTVQNGWKKILVSYAAGGEMEVPSPSPIPCETKWRPSIHMPRWASRLTLEVTSVGVERLKDLSEEDAMAEGAAPYDPTAYFTSYQMNGRKNLPHWEYRAGFAELWNSINGNWNQNPWVWVVKFKRIEAKGAKNG